MPLLHKNSQGPKPGRTTTEGEHRGAQEGSTWGFLPGFMWPNVQTWWLGRREEETQGPGGPLLCSPGQAQEPEFRDLCSYYLPLQSQREGWVPGPR